MKRTQLQMGLTLITFLACQAVGIADPSNVSTENEVSRDVAASAHHALDHKEKDTKPSLGRIQAGDKTIIGVVKKSIADDHKFKIKTESVALTGDTKKQVLEAIEAIEVADASLAKCKLDKTSSLIRSFFAYINKNDDAFSKLATVDAVVQKGLRKLLAKSDETTAASAFLLIKKFQVIVEAFKGKKIDASSELKITEADKQLFQDKLVDEAFTELDKTDVCVIKLKTEKPVETPVASTDTLPMVGTPEEVQPVKPVVEPVSTRPNFSEQLKDMLQKALSDQRAQQQAETDRLTKQHEEEAKARAAAAAEEKKERKELLERTLGDKKKEDDAKIAAINKALESNKQEKKPEQQAQQTPPPAATAAPSMGGGEQPNRRDEDLGYNDPRMNPMNQQQQGGMPQMMQLPPTAMQQQPQQPQVIPVPVAIVTPKQQIRDDSKAPDWNSMVANMVARDMFERMRTQNQFGGNAAGRNRTGGRRSGTMGGYAQQLPYGSGMQNQFYGPQLGGGVTPRF